MANPERHRMVYHVIEDILTLLKSQKDESASNFRNVLYVTCNININDIERAEAEIRKLIDTFENQMY